MQIRPHIHALDSTRRSRAYLVTQPIPFLIDTSMPGSAAAMLAEIGALGVAPTTLRHILLTHHDVDHAGNAFALKEETGASLWISAEDRPLVEGQVPRPGIKRIAAALTRQKAVAVDDILGHLNTESLPGLTILPTPGHTPGHVVFLFDGVLFAGDLVMSRQNRLHPSPRLLTWNSKRLKESIRLVGAHPFEWICPAHGKPLYGRQSWHDLVRSL